MATPATNQTAGLTYTDESIGDLVNKDTDGDSILDWEESLWGTDPTKKDTNGDGVSDSTEIAKLKATSNAGGEVVLASDDKKLTETEKFSDQLLATVTTLNQNGAIDETSIDQISTSLATNIQTTTLKKFYTIKNIKIQNDESKPAVQAYRDKLLALQTKYPLKENIPMILMESINTDGEINVKVLNKFDPIITQLNGIVKDMLTISPPTSMAILHVMVINGFQKLSQNLSDLKLTDKDAIIAFSAANQYEQNSSSLQSYLSQLLDLINQKLNN